VVALENTVGVFINRPSTRTVVSEETLNALVGQANQEQIILSSQDSFKFPTQLFAFAHTKPATQYIKLNAFAIASNECRSFTPALGISDVVSN